ncbi:MAG: hypothetical protein Q9187_005899 [Circinaria calcarea]
MPTRRKKRQPAGRVYETTTRPKQTHFTPRNRTVSARNVSLSTPSARQQTLTQIDFVQRFHPADEDELALIGEEDEPRARKKRKTMPATPRTVLTRAATRRSVKEEAEGDDGDDGPKDNTGERRYHQEADNPLTVPAETAMPPPKTPRTIRKTEIPSSESTATPLSTRSRQSIRSISRSPLKERSTNSAIIQRLQSGVGKKVNFVPKLEIRDTFDHESEGSELSAQVRFTGEMSLDKSGFPLQLSEPSQRGLMSEESQDQVEELSAYHGIQNIKVEIEDSVDGDGEEEPENQEDIKFGVGNETQAALVHAGISSDDLGAGDAWSFDEATESMDKDKARLLMPKAVESGPKSIPRTNEPGQLLEETHDNTWREPMQSIKLSQKEPKDNHQPRPPNSSPITPSKSQSYSAEASAQLTNELRHLTQPKNHRPILETESQFEIFFHDYCPPNRLLSPDDEDTSAQPEGPDSYHAATSEIPLPPPALPRLPIPPSQATTADLTQAPFGVTTRSSFQPFHFSLSPFNGSENDHGSQNSAVWDGKPLTDSQLLPDSLMMDSVHPAPVWEEDGEKAWAME